MHDDCDEHFERPELDADGFYMLYNAGNVEWISQQVADNNIGLDCKLMNDIDFENIENLHSPIGPTNGRKFNATSVTSPRTLLSMKTATSRTGRLRSHSKARLAATSAPTLASRTSIP